MTTNRLEAFSDGVLAIIITIMVLELKVPHEGVTLDALKPMLPVFLSYVLSFIYVGIYWNNHHHMLHAVEHVDGKALWANLFLLFWLSLVPVTTSWMGEHYNSSIPVALYGVVLLMAAVAYTLLQNTLLKLEGKESALARSIGSDGKGKLSLLLYIAGIGLAFVNTWLSMAAYIIVAFMWVVPDKRIENTIIAKEKHERLH